MSFSFKNFFHNLWPDSFSDSEKRVPAMESHGSYTPPLNAVPPPPPVLPQNTPSPFISGIIKSIETEPQKWSIETVEKRMYSEAFRIRINYGPCGWMLWVAGHYQDVSSKDAVALTGLLNRLVEKETGSIIKQMESLGSS